MKISATIRNTTRIYNDTDAIFGLLQMTKKNIDVTNKLYLRIKAGETVKLRYHGAFVYVRKIGV